jgi:hypothetical protein
MSLSYCILQTLIRGQSANVLYSNARSRMILKYGIAITTGISTFFLYLNKNLYLELVFTIQYFVSCLLFNPFVSKV